MDMGLDRWHAFSSTDEHLVLKRIQFRSGLQYLMEVLSVWSHRLTVECNHWASGSCLSRPLIRLNMIILVIHDKHSHLFHDLLSLFYVCQSVWSVVITDSFTPAKRDELFLAIFTAAVFSLIIGHEINTLQHSLQLIIAHSHSYNQL